MSRLQNSFIGIVLLAIGLAAFFQVAQVDPVMRLVSIMLLGVVAAIGALIFFIYAAKDAR
jgi:hypothetical protein